MSALQVAVPILPVIEEGDPSTAVAQTSGQMAELGKHLTVVFHQALVRGPEQVAVDGVSHRRRLFACCFLGLP